MSGKVHSILITVIIAGCAASILFPDIILKSYYSLFTEYEISYASREGSLVKGVAIKNLKITQKNTGNIVSVEKCKLSVLFKESLREKKLIISSKMKSAKVLLRVEGDYPGQSAEAEILRLPFERGLEYSEINFLLLYNIRTIEIRQMQALSPGLKMSGCLKKNNATGNIALNIHVSVSPDFSNDLPGGIISFLLSEEKDGWFGTQIKADINIPDQRFLVSSDRLDIKIGRGKSEKS